MNTHEFVISNRAGKRMPATLRVAGEHVKGTAVVLHGLGGFRNQSIITATADAFCRAGYTTVTFDAADGACGPDGDFLNATNSAYAEDLEDVLARIREESWFTGPLALAGHSQGGLIALHYAARHPGSLSRLVLLSTAISWKQGAWMWWPYALSWLIRGQQRWQGPQGKKLFLGRRWLFDFFSFDGYADAAQVAVPTLIVSAENDETVGKPYTHRALARRFKDARYMLVARAKHAFVGREAEAAGIVEEWLTSS